MENAIRVLIVEDDPLIALDLEDTLENAGYEVSGMARSVDDGLTMIERDPPHVATLDYQLGRETSVPIARALDERHIPYCFVSGRGDLIEADGRPVVAKPAPPSTVLRAVREMTEAAD